MGRLSRMARSLLLLAAGVMSGPPPALAFPTSPVDPKVPDGAVAQAWAFGALTRATQPDARVPCDLSHRCRLVIAADGTTAWIAIKREFAPSGFTFPDHLPFVLRQTVDYPDAVPNGAGGLCFPTSGTLSVDVGASGTLVLALQGEACQSYGNETAALLVNATYAGHRASTGLFKNVQAVGTYTSVGPSGLPGSFTHVKASLNGQLLLLGEAASP
jgi:hypothetical protein